MKKNTLSSLALIFVGAFLGAVAFLPPANGYSYTGPVSKFINSKTHWEIPWLVGAASTLVAAGVVRLIKGEKPE